jgi:hypothetical protein
VLLLLLLCCLFVVVVVVAVSLIAFRVWDQWGLDQGGFLRKNVPFKSLSNLQGLLGRLSFQVLACLIAVD